MKSLVFFAAITLAVTTAPALAQTVTPSASSPVIPGPVTTRLSNPNFVTSPSAMLGDRVDDPARPSHQSAEQRMAVENASPARLDRAQRVAELINSGNCAEASALVNRENDHRLARRVSEICQSRN